MPMTTSSVPHLRGNPVADPKNTTAGTAKTDRPAAGPGPLAPAGQAGDPAVQKLLADREGHRLALDPDPDAEARRVTAQQAIDVIDAELERLGFTAR